MNISLSFMNFTLGEYTRVLIVSQLNAVGRDHVKGQLTRKIVVLGK